MRRGPYELAEHLGIELVTAPDLPFRVGINARRVIYCWDPMRAIREARIYEGIAQFVLTRLGVNWSEGAALRLAEELSSDGAKKKAS
jgi:hypothetical protein